MQGTGASREGWVQVISAYAGWLMDGYTTIAYALAAVTLSSLFFPSRIGFFGLIATFGGLASEEVARPVGAVILGNFLGDRVGRKSMLTLTILGFSLFSAAKGLLPTYSTAGFLAPPLLLYILLFAEGLFAGAEYGGGTALSMESVPARIRGPVGAFVQSGYGTGFFIVSFVYAALSTHYGQAGFTAMGWRILFFTTAVPGLLTLAIRAAARESGVFSDMKERQEIEKEPVSALFTRGWAPPLAFSLVLTSGLLFINAATFTFYPSLLSILHPGISGSLVGTYSAYINLVSLFGVWLGGLIALMVPGRRVAMLVYGLTFTVTVYPPTAFFAFHGTPSLDLAMFSVQAFFEAMVFSTLPAFLSETFSKKYRATGVGFAYNGGGVMAGFAISIVLYTSVLVKSLFTAWTMWLLIAGAVMLVGTALSKETWKRGGGEDAITW